MKLAIRKHLRDFLAIVFLLVVALIVALVILVFFAAGYGFGRLFL